MDMRKLVGRNVARLRGQKRLTQEQLATRSGFSQQYISGLERGRRNPTVLSLYELAQALGVSHMELVKPDGVDDRHGPVDRLEKAARNPARRRKT
jgi:transcriptional regulator with XRE-family HTH domain